MTLLTKGLVPLLKRSILLQSSVVPKQVSLITVIHAICPNCVSFFQCLPVLNFSSTTSLNAPKFCASPLEAVQDIPDGSKLLVGGK